MKKNLLLFLSIFCSITLWAQDNIHDLRFNKEKKFKIVQFTDMHYEGRPGCEPVITMMHDIINAEDPDLVVLSGDIVTGGDEFMLWREVIAPIARRDIRYVVTFGNHDTERFVTREELYPFIYNLPFCINQQDVCKKDGVQVLKIKSEDGSSNQALIYLFDSNEYTSEKPKKYAGIQPWQVEWYTKKSAEMNKGTKLNALAFFHVPLQEYYDGTANTEQKQFGAQLEGHSVAPANAGLFQALINGGDVTGVFVGHDHNNDCIGYVKGIALGYGRFSGAKYAYHDLVRGARVFELTEGEKGFNTWIRTEGLRITKKFRHPDDFLKKP